MKTQLHVTYLVIALLSLVPCAIAAQPPEVTAEWRAQVLGSAIDYELAWLDEAPVAGAEQAWHAENVRQELQTVFLDEEFLVMPRGADAPPWTFGLSLLRYGRKGWTFEAPLVQGSFAVKNRFEFQREGIVEWYVNRPEGLEQGFEIAEPFAGPREQPFTIDLELSGELRPVFAADGQSVEFFDSRSDLALRYDKLLVIDTRGVTLPSRIEGFSGRDSRGIRLVIDDRDATYPIVIDPLMTTASWIEFGAPGDQYGEWVAAAGDVNADGYGDVVIGTSRYANSESFEGHAELFLGTASGLATTAAWAAEGNEAGASCGKPVTAAGDINADGYADIAVGCPYSDVGGTNAGAVNVYFGSATGPSLTPDVVLTGTVASDEFGYSVSTAGDFNNDGFSDLIVGSRDSVNGYTGKATLFTGSAGGLTLLATFLGDAPLDKLGYSVAGGGDFNNDGFDDVVVGAPGTDQGGPDHGGAHVWLGAPSGVGTHLTFTVPPMLSLDARMGGAAAFLGDTDGDGTSDFVVGAEGHDTYHGAVVVFHGPTGSSWSVLNRESGAAPPSPPFVYFGFTVAGAGDVNDDGYADLLVGSDSYSQSGLIEGAAYVFTGPFDSGLHPDDPVWTKVGDPEDLFGTRVAATDVNGDGRPDMIVSAIGDDVTPDGTEGSVSVFHSMRADGFTLAPVETDAFSPVGPTISALGDVNGDGFIDVGAGHGPGEWVKVYHGSASGLPSVAPWAPSVTVVGTIGGALFGASLDGAGDVNGDGFEDLVVGSPAYQGTVSEEGQVSLFLGSSSGLASSAAWSFASGQVNSNLGDGLTGLGDINGDGYADIAAGAPNWSNGESLEGAVFVFHGSPSGFGASFDQRLEIDYPDAAFGLSIDSAGDVNADGYSDLIVGAPRYFNGVAEVGAAYLFLGGPAGLSAIPDWQAVSNLGLSRFAEKVAGVGDLNGDGFADVAVGAHGYSNPEPDEGAVWVYFGNPMGLPATPDLILESNTGSAHMGRSVVSPGDVNGDGFSDLAVSGANNNWAGIFYGSAAGLSSSPNATVPAGIRLDGGDINGDGYADLIDNNPSGIDVFYMHTTVNLDRNRSIRLRRSDDGAPIAPLGVSDSSTSFGFLAQPSTLFGRGDVAVEVEVKPFGVPFDGLGTLITPFRDNGTAPVPEVVDGLSPGTLYHWRTRQVYDPVTLPWFPRGPWLPAPNNAWTELDFRTAGNATASAVPDGNMVSGAPLTVAMDDSDPMNPQIQLNWGESCGGQTTDYAIYVGTIGDFTSHMPCTCSTGGLTNFAYPPDEIMPQYYLVVPVNTAGQREGSYGVNSGGTARPASLAACYPTGEPATCNP